MVRQGEGEEERREEGGAGMVRQGEEERKEEGEAGEVQQIEEKEEEEEKVESEEERETVVREVVLSDSEVDMEGEEENLRVPRLKRKCGGGDGENPQPKKVTAGRRRSRRRGAESSLE